MLTLADVSKSHGPRTLFEGVSVFVSRGDRLGLVGPNGAGKTTLFNVIAGEETVDSGTITWEKGSSFGYLPQETSPAGDETILDLATAVTPEFARLRAEIRSMDGGGAPACMQAELDAHHRFEELGGYGVETKARIVLTGLGFRPADLDRPALTFSGGWVMRAHLARLLVREPALLLLDEPTNHLDLEVLLWFQDYLTRYPGGLIIISHDRAFLNALCTGILELRDQTLYRWTGDYDDFIRQKEAHREQQISLHKNQQREIAHLQRFVDRFGAKASLASRAKSKEKQIERLKEEAIDAPEDDIRRITFRFPQPARSGLRVVTLKGVRQAYGENVVYRNLSFHAERGGRLVLVGPNGAGKSTLLKVLAGAIPIQAGTRELGGNVTAGYFAQNRLDNLDARRTVLEEAMEMRNRNPDVTERLARTVLGGFLFRKDDVFKRVSVLSGGEKSRLALARLLLAPPNLLLMDEPTTHLDIASIDALVNALRQYEGTLIFISHDVHFIRSVAKSVLHVAAGHLTPYAGDYDYYLEKSRASGAREALTARLPDAGPVPAAPAPAAAGRGGPKTREQKRAEAERRSARSAPLRAKKAHVSGLEREISGLEARQAELAAELEAPETYSHPGRAQALNRELSIVVDRLQAATADWERAAAELEGIEKAGG
ncbi:MAG TPA: ABC-F family ATP-binding cassette domain-containing protein [Opitutaceae bacterium]|nr:ABC-F family ATP-binding cassette domain-containing protein [Opitutaceae bacterium]